MQITLKWKFHIIILIINLILILFISNQAISPTGYPYLSDFSFQILSKLEKCISSISNIILNINKYFKSINEQSKKIEELEKKLAEFEIQNKIFAKIKEENYLLRKQLELKRRTDYRLVSADIIGYDFKSEFLKVIRINRGGNDGIKKNFPVVIPQGVVGMIIKVSSDTSEVLLLISSSSAIGISIPEAKTNSIAYGSGADYLKIKFVPISANIYEGLQVITSGTDNIYPPGLPVAITTSSSSKLGLYQEIIALPSVNFYYLNTVMVLIPEKTAK